MRSEAPENRAEPPEAGIPQPRLDDFLQGIIPPAYWPRLARFAAKHIEYIEHAGQKAKRNGLVPPEIPAALQEWADFTADAAKKFAGQQATARRIADLEAELAAFRAQPAATCVGPSPARAAVVALPQNSPFSEEQWIGTEEASRITGLSRERMRQIAANGEKVRAEKAGRQWWIHTSSLRAWDEKRRGVHGADGGEDDGQSPGGEPQRADSGGAEGRGQAA